MGLFIRVQEDEHLRNIALQIKQVPQRFTDYNGGISLYKIRQMQRSYGEDYAQ